VIGEIFEQAVESIEVGPSSKWGQTVVRIGFGLLGVLLCVAGAVHVLVVGVEGARLHFNLAAASIFVSLSALCLFNITCLRAWRWPGRAFVLSFVTLFLVRIFFGP
jgi:hypothetical protein